MRVSEQNRAQNERIKGFNKLLFDFIESNDSDTTIKLLPLAESLRGIPNYYSYYYDEIHLTFSLGLPFLENLLLSVLLATSNGLPAKPKHMYHPRPQQRHHNNVWRNAWYPKQTYNYLDGFNERF